MPFPNANVLRQTFAFRDAKGNIAVERYFINVAAGALADANTLALNLENALVAATNSAIQSATGPHGAVGVVQYGGTGAYQDVPQKAVLVMQDGSGVLHRYTIPAPKTSLFLADLQTIDPTKVVGAGLVATVLLSNVNGVFFCDKSGANQLVNFMGGFFRAGKIRRRTNVLVLTPSLTGGEPAE